MWKPIVESIINHNHQRAAFKKRPTSNEEQELEDFSRHFHVLGIDILIASNLKPIVLELNDRPSMVVYIRD